MEIGEHCFFKSCKRLDFLPFTCEQCQRVFCKDHRFPDQHDCEHPLPKEQQPNDSEPKKATIRSFDCSVDGCERKEMMAVNCPGCGANFCLQHRHKTEHDCPELLKQPLRKLPTGAMKSAPSIAGQTGLTGKSGTWSSAKAARLESTRSKLFMMKLKMKAEGSDAIPLTERLYYQVQLPSGEGERPSKPMFFSKEWSVGKAVDYIAQKHKLKNENNQAHPKQRLVLCTLESEEVLEMSKPLKTFLDSSMPNGATVILKYNIS